MTEIIDLVELRDKRMVVNGLGEVLDEYKQSDKEKADINRARGFVKKTEKEKRYKSQNQITDLFGQYIHYFYNQCPDIEKQYKVRFIRMASLVCGCDGYIRIGNTNQQHNVIGDTELMEWLRLGRKAFYKTKQVFLDSNMIIRDENGYRINVEVAKKGTVIKKCDYIRVFTKGFNEIYENAKATDHKLIGNLIELIPYCNHQYNVLCHNPKEADARLVKGLKMVEVAELLGYDKRSLTKLRTDLLKCTINGEYAFKGILDNKDAKNIIFYISPALYYRGSYDGMEHLKKVFSIGSK